MNKQKRLTRREATALVYDALKLLPVGLPNYEWSAVLADMMCVDKRYIKNMAAEGRKTIGDNIVLRYIQASKDAQQILSEVLNSQPKVRRSFNPYRKCDM